MRTIQVPASADIPFPELAEQLRLQGMTVTLVTADRIEARLAASVHADPLTLDRWLPGITMIMARSAAGVVISHRRPMLRIVPSSLFTGALLSTVFPGGLGGRLMIGGGFALFGILMQTFWRRPPPTFLAFPQQPLGEPSEAGQDEASRLSQ